MATAPLTRPTSRLESLPVEILELIFLHSLEINLPRSTLHLSRALSNPVLYTWFIRLAFSSPNRSSRDLFTIDFLPPPLDIWNLSPEQRQSLQTALLECCWCTLSFMRRCQRDYMYHVIRHQRSQLQLRFDPDAEAQLAHLDPFFTGLSHADRPSNSKGDVIIPSRAPDGSRRKLALWFHRGAVQIRPPREIFIEDDVFRLPCSSAIAPGRIPNKLLREPWTNDKLEFLELLSADFYLPEAEGLRENILAKMIRKRQISPFRRLMRMKFRTAECRVPQGWPVPKLIYPLVRKYGDGPGMGDPFALFLLDERWEDIAEAAKDKLIQYVNVEYG